MWNLWHIPKLRIRRKAHVCRLVTSPPFMRMILHKKVEPTKNTAHTRWGCPPHHFAVWVRCMTYHDIIINIYKSPQDTPSVYSSYRPRSSHIARVGIPSPFWHLVSEWMPSLDLSWATHAYKHTHTHKHELWTQIMTASPISIPSGRAASSLEQADANQLELVGVLQGLSSSRVFNKNCKKEEVAAFG